MVSEGTENNNTNHDLSPTTGTDDTTEQIWDFQEYDMDTLVGEDVNARINNDAEGSKDNQPQSVASPKLKRHNAQQIKALEKYVIH